MPRRMFVDLDAFTSTVSASGSPPAPTAPTGPYELGVEVGVPTGTVLTDTAGLPAEPDAIEQITITHPVTGQQATLTFDVYRRRRWTSTLQFGVVEDRHIYFDECLWDRTEGDPFFCVDVVDLVPVTDIMAPIVVFNRCQLDGNGDTGQSLSARGTWAIRTQFDGAADAWFDWSLCVTDTCNVFSNYSVEGAHTDGIQNPGRGANAGSSIAWQTWFDIGTDPVVVNADLFLGPDEGPISNVGVYYCGFSGGAYSLYCVGDATNGVSDLTVIGNRFVDNALFGPVDFDFVTDVTWEDNAFMDGTPIPEPT